MSGLAAPALASCRDVGARETYERLEAKTADSTSITRPPATYLIPRAAPKLSGRVVENLGAVAWRRDRRPLAPRRHREALRARLESARELNQHLAKVIRERQTNRIVTIWQGDGPDIMAAGLHGSSSRRNRRYIDQGRSRPRRLASTARGATMTIRCAARHGRITVQLISDGDGAADLVAANAVRTSNESAAFHRAYTPEGATVTAAAVRRGHRHRSSSRRLPQRAQCAAHATTETFVAITCIWKTGDGPTCRSSCAPQSSRGARPHQHPVSQHR